MMSRAARRNRRWAVMACLGLGALGGGLGCASTQVTNAWTDPAAARQGELKKVLVVSTAKRPELRREYEDQMAARLRKDGVQAVESYRAIPSDDEQAPRSDQLQQVVQRGGFDGLIISRFAGRRTVAHEEPVPFPEPLVGVSPWGLYEEWAFGGPDEMLVLDEEAAVETRVFRTSGGQETLAWSGRTETEDPRNERAIINGSVDKVVKALEKTGLV